MQTTTTTLKNNIGGNLKESNSNDFFEKYNPADKSECIGKFPKSNQKDLSDAVKKEKLHLKSGGIPRHQKEQKFYIKQHRLLQKKKKNFQEYLQKKQENQLLKHEVKSRK